uniref:Uncharacterized protein n=1 Tax=Caenorhabditis japonica TaxID=281687 RepID=A0A8R1IYL7_CAEJA
VEWDSMLSVTLYLEMLISQTHSKTINPGNLKVHKYEKEQFQALIAAAINRAASTNEADRHNVLPIYITTLAHELNVFGAREEELPTYEEALSMSCTPSPNPVSAPTNRDRVPPYKPRSGKTGRVLR